MWRLRAEQQLCVKPDKAEGASVVLLLTQNAVFAQAAAGGLHLMKWGGLLHAAKDNRSDPVCFFFMFCNVCYIFKTN